VTTRAQSIVVEAAAATEGAVTTGPAVERGAVAAGPEKEAVAPIATPRPSDTVTDAPAEAAPQEVPTVSAEAAPQEAREAPAEAAQQDAPKVPVEAAPQDTPPPEPAPAPSALPPGPPGPRRPPPPPPAGRRVAVITGGTSGIGFTTAVKLLRRNDFDVIIGANEAHGPEAADASVAALKASVPYMDEPDAPRLLALPLDLAKPTSVEDFATRVMAISPKVHWLFLNAGVGDVSSSMWGSEPVLTQDGHERTVAVNYHGHYLLTRHLLKALTFAAPSRVVAVSCSRHTHAWHLDHTNWQMLNPAPWWQPVRFKAGDAYNNSKVMCIAHAFKFSRTYAVANGVSCNAVDPGIVPGTGLLRDQTPFFRAAYEHVTAPTWSVALHVVTPEQAADAIIAAAEHPKGSTYFVGTSPDGKPAAQTRDEALQQLLWDDTAKLLGVEWPVPGTDL